LYQELEDKGRRLIVTYNPMRAKKDKHDREELIKKLREKVGTKISSL
jgi:hypothetical protein